LPGSPPAHTVSISLHDALPISITVADLPGGKYAVTRFEGSPAVIADAWDNMYSSWLPISGYQPEDRPRLELRSVHDMRLPGDRRSEEHTSELQSRFDLVCRPPR